MNMKKNQESWYLHKQKIITSKKILLDSNNHRIFSYNVLLLYKMNIENLYMCPMKIHFLGKVFLLFIRESQTLKLVMYHYI